MRYLMIAVFGAMLTAPLIGCESHEKESTTRNPITGSETHTTDKSMSGN